MRLFMKDVSQQLTIALEVAKEFINFINKIIPKFSIIP